MGEIRIIPLTGIPEVGRGDDLGALVGDAVERAGGLEEGDVLVVAQKVVSKAEGRVEETDDVLEVILREARAVRRRRDELVIAETEHGFVCASAGVDRSNTPGEGWVVLLPRDPDASAAADSLRARGALRCRSRGRRQRFVRPGLAPGDDRRRHRRLRDEPAPRPARNRRCRRSSARVDDHRRRRRAGRSGRARHGEGGRRPRGARPRLPCRPGDGSARELVMPPERDLFP